jgi:hypothetical protein
MRPKYIVFDLDDVLVDPRPTISGGRPINRATLERRRLTKHFFQERGAIVVTQTSDGERITHFVFPGVIELLKMLMLREDIKLAFFSAGSSERNNSLVDQLLKLAFNTSEAPYNPVIFSREHLMPISYSEAIGQYNNYRIYNDNPNRKDLNVLGENEWQNAVLIDDVHGNASFNQVQHLLVAPRQACKYFAGLIDYPNHPLPGECGYETDVYFSQTNGIFYITGMLLELLGENQNTHFTNRLFNLQFQQLIMSSGYEPNVRNLHAKKSYYERGLAELQKYNPNLKFMTLETAQEWVALQQSRQSITERPSLFASSGPEDNAVKGPSSASPALVHQ